MGCLRIILLVLITCSNGLANTYYLDAIDGSDSNDGSISSPWKTFSKSIAATVSGDMVYMESGAYGTYTEADQTRTDYITYEEIEGAVVTMTGVSIENTFAHNTYLSFVGVYIQPVWVDPGVVDPQYPDSTQSSYNKSLSAVILTNTNYVEFTDCEIEGQNKYLSPYGVHLLSSNYVTVDNCYIHTFQRCMTIVDSSNTTVKDSHLYFTSASAVSIGDETSEYSTFDNNHIHSGGYNIADDYCPRADGQTPHSSAIAIRSDHTTISNNTIHDGYNSSGIMLYDDDAGNVYHFDNILIENNLIYDIENGTIMTFFKVGDSVVLRNNTFIGHTRPENGGEYKMLGAIYVVSLDTDGAPHMDLYNNVLMGYVELGSFSSSITLENNYIWSLHDSTWTCDGSAGTNKVLTCTYGGEPFDEMVALFNNMTSYQPNHGLYQDLTLSDTSDAINFGDSTLQSIDGLGSLNSSKAFVVDNGITRTSSLHSAGAYEVGSRAWLLGGQTQSGTGSFTTGTGSLTTQ